ncbi:MAG TPA: hypothetical protein VJ869_15300 [Sphaerochaeta sp.]|nr:hypothetical protein [Sphaerochaeta sp.]
MSNNTPAFLFFYASYYWKSPTERTSQHPIAIDRAKVFDNRI